ncbi:MAG: hypothetical protein IJY92_05050 [Alphaproteobacteria bacterium]|nr:hypothetical protein [Alphaproteobacteria bacterium]
MSVGLGAYYLRKALELGDVELLKEVLSPFLSEKPVATKKIKQNEVISSEDLIGVLLHPVPGELLLKAARNNNSEMLDVLMKGINRAVKDPELNHRIYRYGIHPFEVEGDAKTVQRFIDNGFQPAAEEIDCTLFRNYKPNVLQVYLDNGAVERSNPCQIARSWMAGVTRFNVPKKERQDILNNLISHGMDIKNEYILHSTLDPQLDWKKEAFQELIEAGAPIETERSSIDPLMAALSQNNLVAAEVLIDKTPAEKLHKPNMYGVTPMMIIASNPHYLSVNLLEKLVQKGADVNAVDNEGRNALMYVRDNKTAEALIKMGANVFQKDKRGRSVVDVIASQRAHYGGWGSISASEAVQAHIDAIKSSRSKPFDKSTSRD